MTTKQEIINQMEKELNADTSLYDITKALINVRCAEYCPMIDVDNVLDAWEWCDEDEDEDKSPTPEQLDRIISKDFLIELHEKIWEQISIWLCEQIENTLQHEGRR